MNKKDKSFESFLEVAFPIKNPFLRKDNGIIHNSIKWISIRFSYLFYRLGITANILDLIGLLMLIPSYYFIYISIINKNLNLFIVSYFLIMCVLAIDFMDGMLAKTDKYKYSVGEILDDLSPEIIRFLSLLIIGFLSNNLFFFIIAFMSAVIQQTFIFSTVNYIDQKFHLLILLLRHKYSLQSIRILSCLIVPISVCLYFQDILYLSIFIKCFILLNFILSFIWIIITLKQKKIS